MRDLQCKVAVVTGAGSGIGRALSVQLARKGCKLAIADVSEAGLLQTRSLVLAESADCTSHVVDVSDRAAVEVFADDVVREHGGVHLLINNAGVTLIETIERADYDGFEWLMGINFWGVVYGTKAFLPHMQAGNDGHIVNISSLFGLMAMPLQSAYNASKFAVRGFTEALRLEMTGSPIEVSCVHPGGIKTSIVDNARFGAESVIGSRAEIAEEFDALAKTTADGAARTIIRGVEKNKSRILIGVDAKIADKIVRLFPGSYENFVGLVREVQARARERSDS